MYDFGQLFEHFRRQPQVVDAGRGAGGIEDSHHQLLPHDGRREADAVIQPAGAFLQPGVGHAGGKRAFLDRLPLGDVDLAKDLHHRRQLGAQHRRELGDIDHDPVDAQPQVLAILPGL